MTTNVSQSMYAGWEYQGQPGHETDDDSELGMFAMVDAFMQAAPYATAFITGGLKSCAADFIAQTQELRSKSSSGSKRPRTFNTDETRDGDGASTVELTPILSKAEEGINNEDDESSISSTSQKSKQQQVSTSTTQTTKRKKKKSTICLKRNFAFLLYGALCCGVAYEWIYNVAFPQMFGHETHLQVALMKTSVELFVISPIFTIPTSYLITATVTGTSYRDAMIKYWHDVTQKRLLMTYCAVFGPFQVILFTLVPAYLRMTLASIVSFIWLMILSQVSTSDK